ncbi:MAG: hypothetical protein E6Q96_06960 [Cyclobacteriaceae bacterium]|nr:MAG: hypothetical protein E6Q96_06960 [Cyclobacteriaceae bacterium]
MNLKSRDPEIITGDTYGKLSGRYENVSMEYTGRATLLTTDQKPRQLWRHLTGRSEVADQECSVVIEFLSSRRAIAKLYCCDSLIDSVTLKGKVKGSFFLSSRWKIIPFFPIAFGYRKDSFGISLLSRNLMVDCHWDYRLYTPLGAEEGRGESWIFSGSLLRKHQFFSNCLSNGPSRSRS